MTLHVPIFLNHRTQISTLCRDCRQTSLVVIVCYSYPLRMWFNSLQGVAMICSRSFEVMDTGPTSLVAAFSTSWKRAHVWLSGSRVPLPKRGNLLLHQIQRLFFENYADKINASRSIAVCSVWTLNLISIDHMAVLYKSLSAIRSSSWWLTTFLKLSRLLKERRKLPL